MEKARLSWENWIDPAWGAGAVSATSEAGNMPASNLTNSQPSLPWRSDGFGDQVLSGDFGRLRVCACWGIFAHKFQPTATARLELATDAAYSNVVYDATVPTQNVVYGLGEGPLGLYGLGGFSTEGWQAPFFLKWHPRAVARCYRVTLSGQTSGYYQAGRLWTGNFFEPETRGANIAWGYSAARRNNAKGKMARNGGWRAERGANSREMAFSYQRLTAKDAARLDDCVDFVGRNRNVIFSAYPELRTTKERRHTVLAFMVSASELSRTMKPFRSQKFKIREAI